MRWSVQQRRQRSASSALYDGTPRLFHDLPPVPSVKENDSTLFSFLSRRREDFTLVRDIIMGGKKERENKTHQSAEEVVIVATSQVDVFDVLDDDLRSQCSAAIEDDEFTAVPVDRFQRLQELDRLPVVFHTTHHLDEHVVVAAASGLDPLVQLLQSQ